MQGKNKIKKEQISLRGKEMFLHTGTIKVDFYFSVWQQEWEQDIQHILLTRNGNIVAIKKYLSKNKPISLV